MKGISLSRVMFRTSWLMLPNSSSTLMMMVLRPGLRETSAANWPLEVATSTSLTKTLADAPVCPLMVMLRRLDMWPSSGDRMSRLGATLSFMTVIMVWSWLSTQS